MWTLAARAQLARDDISYATCLTDQEWDVVAPFMSGAAETGRPVARYGRLGVPFTAEPKLHFSRACRLIHRCCGTDAEKSPPMRRAGSLRSALVSAVPRIRGSVHLSMARKFPSREMRGKCTFCSPATGTHAASRVRLLCDESPLTGPGSVGRGAGPFPFSGQTTNSIA